MVVKVAVEGEGGSGVSTRQVKSSVQQLANIKRMLSSVSESVREMGQRHCIHFGRIAETTSRLNDLIVMQTEF